MSCSCCDPEAEARFLAEALAALPKKERDAAVAELVKELAHRDAMMKALFVDKKPISGGSFTIPLSFGPSTK